MEEQNENKNKTIVKLETRTTMTGEMQWYFEPFTTKLFPIIEDFAKLGTTQRMNYNGELS